MKIPLYFKDKAEFDAYWQDDEPGTKFKCVIMKKNKMTKKLPKSEIEVEIK